MEIPNEWKGTLEQWNRVIEAFGDLAVAIKEAFKPIIKSFQELYCSLKKKMQKILYTMLERFYREFVLDGGI